MSVQVSTREYRNFGRTVHLENGYAEADITLDIGPRILHYSLPGGRNIMFNDVDRVFSFKGPEFDAMFGPDTCWYIYGGHRLWISPEDLPRSYFPDNVPVEFQQTRRGGIFTQVPQTVNGYQFSMEIEMDEDGPGLHITHRVLNISDREITLAPWALTVLDKNGVEIIPVNSQDTGVLPNGRMTLWPYATLGDPRVHFFDKHIVLRQDPSIERRFKIGLDLRAGTSVYVLDDTVFVKRYTHNENGTYPDFGVSFETFTNAHFLEMESLGQLQTLSPGDLAVHEEKWCVLKKQGELDPADENSVAQFMGRHI